jgi:hypothetical protein
MSRAREDEGRVKRLRVQNYSDTVSRLDGIYVLGESQVELYFPMIVDNVGASVLLCCTVSWQ